MKPTKNVLILRYVTKTKRLKRQLERAWMLEGWQQI